MGDVHPTHDKSHGAAGRAPSPPLPNCGHPMQPNGAHSSCRTPSVHDVVGVHVGSAIPLLVDVAHNDVECGWHPCGVSHFIFLVDVAHNDVEVDARTLAALTLIIAEVTSVNLFRIAGASRASSRALMTSAI